MDEVPQETVDRFIQDQIDSVPHLEALLLLWNSRPKAWSPQEIAKALFVEPPAARRILHDLQRQKLIAPAGPTYPESYAYREETEMEGLLEAVALHYRRGLIRITQMIHAKGPASVREFAKAFRFTKETE